MKYAIGAALGLAAYLAWQVSRGTQLNQAVGAAMRDPRAYAAVAVGAVGARFVR